MREDSAATLPKGWSLIPLGQLMKFQNGFNTDKTAYGRGLRFANVLEVITNTHLSSHMIPGRVATSAAETARYHVQRGDILFNRTSETQEEVGLASVYLDDEPILFGGFVLRGKPTSDLLDPVFAGYGLRSQIVRQQIMAAGQGGIRANIGQQSLSEIQIALPEKLEQEAIAEALSDADALIEGLERLIAKKRLIKQGAMQDLLTAKRRLPGFSGEWIETTVGAVVTRNFCGPSPTCEERNVSGDEWGVLKTTAITFERGWDWRKHKALPKSYWANRKALIETGDVIVTKAGPRHRVGVPASVDFVPDNILVSGKMIGLRPDQGKATPLMLASAIASKEAQVFLDQRTTGMAESQVNFNNDDLLNTPISLPDIEEQRAISNLAADFDAETQALGARLEKARQVKEGMMQNLLTGRIRLV